MKNIIKQTASTLAVASIIFASAASSAGEDHSHHHMHKTYKSAPKLTKKLRKNMAVQEYITASQAMHEDMMKQEYTGNTDVDFTAGMIPHHMGAVYMARVELRHGKDEELRELAQRIITAQEAEIGFMTQWLAGRTSDWKAENVDELESVKEFRETMAKMHSDMNIQYTGDADVDFARGMIPHHQAAIEMAWTLKRSGMDRQLSELADDIIRSQGQEIRLMQAWLEKHDVPAPAPKKHKRHKKSQ